MKSNCMLIGCVVLMGLLSSCRSLDLPSVEESQKTIDRLKTRIALADRAIIAVSAALPTGSDMTVRIRMDVLNRLLRAVADNRSDDVRVLFPPTRPLLSESKSLLGISYTNYVNIDTGAFSINLKEFRLEKAERNLIDASIHLEGKGKVSASGRYTGIPASASPDVELLMNERIQLRILPDGNAIVLQPVDKQVLLKATIFVSLLEWKIPWRKDIPLRLADLIKPISIPMNLTTELPFPVPASQPGDEKTEYMKKRVELVRTTILTNGNSLRLSTDFELHGGK